MKSTHSEAVLQAQQENWSVLQNKDRGAFELLLSDDFISRSPGQPNQNRTAFIDTLTSFPVQVRAIGADNLEIHVWDSFAVVTGVQSAQLEFTGGQVRENWIAITNIFQRHEGRWLLKLSRLIRHLLLFFSCNFLSLAILQGLRLYFCQGRIQAGRAILIGG